jgi:MoxR-like ATPase
VLPEDVSSLAHDVLRHRLVLTYEALADGVDADQLIDQVVDAVNAPEVSLSRTEEAA